ncbi:oligopeptide/dipeptide ABC transporter ATP-binding protein [Conexibacter sp. S30A1]|uniref:oligopeptide/dipeptide ABC transporter ATP-binding protein n=1 Tax=Conexibacter sp. S30A1 TaxID=2937800 RepID=UPI00200C9C70|nr:oligopeptide/dipeptide ABC transporter ATP-binding protein [Conexibacter sp. S30A1]
MSEPLLSVEGLVVDYQLPRGQLRRALDDVSFNVLAGQTVGLVGESGSGKSTIARAIVGLAPITAGTVTLGGGAAAAPRQSVQMVFQDPYSSLDPTKTIGYSVAEPLRVHHGRELGAQEVRARTEQMLESVGIQASAAKLYPAQFSGGQRQRIAIARALIVKPKLVICDEALSALDLSVQAQIINLLVQLRETHGISYLFISHDLSVVEMLCDEVVVLYRGRIAETGPARAVSNRPRHPYTRGLVAAVPEIDPVARAASRATRERLRKPVAPAPPLEDSCQYRHRCVFATEQCEQSRPALRLTDGPTLVACHRYEEVARDLDEKAESEIPAMTPQS